MQAARPPRSAGRIGEDVIPMQTAPAPPMNAIVRPLTAQDLPGLLAVQRACYGDGYVESAAVYARRLACPTQCSVVLERAGQLCAYLAAYDSG